MKVIVTKSKLENLADKVRAKAGTQAEMTIDEMATAVENIPSGGTDGQFFPMNMTEFMIPKTTIIVAAKGQIYNSSITYYTDSTCTTESDMSSYQSGDTITDTVYYIDEEEI